MNPTKCQVSILGICCAADGHMYLRHEMPVPTTTPGSRPSEDDGHFRVYRHRFARSTQSVLTVCREGSLPPFYISTTVPLDGPSIDLHDRLRSLRLQSITMTVSLYTFNLATLVLYIYIAEPLKHCRGLLYFDIGCHHPTNCILSLYFTRNFIHQVSITQHLRAELSEL